MIGVFHGVLYTFQLPLLEHELVEYESTRMIALTIAFLGPLLWLAPSLAFKKKVG
jgi:hypothetical protein